MLGSKTSRRSLSVTLAVAVALTQAPLLRAMDVYSAKALQVKAAFVYNFAKFIQWPKNAFEDTDTPFIIGVLGRGAFASVLEKTVSGKKIGTRPIQFRQFDWRNQQDRWRLQSCHILYINASTTASLDAILRSLEEHPVLVVGDVPGFAKTGGTIGLFLHENRISFEINRDAAVRAKLKISAKLLKLGRIVTSTN